MSDEIDNVFVNFSCTIKLPLTKFTKHEGIGHDMSHRFATSLVGSCRVSSLTMDSDYSSLKKSVFKDGRRYEIIALLIL